MIKRMSAVVLLAFLLSGCISTGQERSPAQHYQLMPTQAKEGAAETARQYPLVLRVNQPTAPAWLDTTRMHYRLVYKDENGIAAYAHSSWVEPPPAMLEQALQARLAGSGTFRAVTHAGEAGSPDLALHFSLSAFQQRFTSRNNSAGVLEAQVTLINLHTGKVMSQHRFHYRVTALTADAKGGVQALNAATGQWTGAVTKWVRHALAQCKHSCSGN